MTDIFDIFLCAFTHAKKDMNVQCGDVNGLKRLHDDANDGYILQLICEPHCSPTMGCSPYEAQLHYSTSLHCNILQETVIQLFP